MHKGLALIIEDDADLVDIFSEAIHRAGYDVEKIQSGDVAIHRLGNVLPAVVVLDLHLPEVSGVELLSFMRSDERFANTRIIVVSADAALAETLRDEVDLVLIKPVPFSQLRDLAKRL